ncbi:alpha/beta hydrolase [Edaphobacter bradus]|uniref:alpha/beta hydrolase n=1 Tax=Edaphobacter bradus TaxID=2259016 RepID=UPI0021E0A5CE|nr:alpha/beta hydrolase [Edaphobacter bradus]
MVQQQQPAAQGIPVLDPKIQDFLDQLAAHEGPPIYTLTPDEARSALLRMQSGFVRKPDVQVEDRNVGSGPRALRLRIVRPHPVIDGGPVIMYFHGAGWVMGDPTTHDRLVRELAVGASATVVFVDYDRAPEHGYPVAIEEAYAATLYVSEHAEEFRVDETRLAVAGDSVGGNMATIVSLLAKQRSVPTIAGQLLFYPVTNADFETGWYKQFADGPWLRDWPCSGSGTSIFRTTTSARIPPRLRCWRRRTNSLAYRALIITAENDVLRDEGEAYGRKLIEAGVEVVSTRYNAAIHDFVLLNSLAEAAPTRAAVTQAVNFLKSVLAAKPNREKHEQM